MTRRRKAYIIAPGEMTRPQLLFWLEDHGFNRHRDITFIHESRGVTLATCAAIRQALSDEVDMAVFCEHDALPSARETDSFFLENRYHLQCVKYDTERVHAFNRFDSFHSLIWRASGASLRAMAQVAKTQGKPLCYEQHSEFGDMGICCHCQSLANFAKAAGLSTGWVGNAGHVPKQSSIVPRIVTYAP